MSHKALWKQVHDQILTDVQTGVFPAGERLPGEGALASRYGASRATVRAALSSLRANGLIVTRAGYGSVATELAGIPDPHFVHDLAVSSRLAEQVLVAFRQAAVNAGHSNPDQALIARCGAMFSSGRGGFGDRLGHIAAADWAQFVRSGGGRIELVLAEFAWAAAVFGMVPEFQLRPADPDTLHDVPDDDHPSGA